MAFKTQRSRRGFTLVEMMIVLVVLAIASAIAYVELAPASDTAGMVSMERNLETFSALETRQFKATRRYEPPESLLARGAMGLSDRVVVDSMGFTGSRVYLRLRHLDTPERCSVDLSAVSERARNYIQCFGGAAPDSVERPRIADGPEIEVPDTIAIVRPPVVPPSVVVREPAVSDPPDLSVEPGGAVRQTFRVTNPSVVAREYGFRVTSSDGTLVPAPASPAPRVVGPGETIDLAVESALAGDASAGRATAIALEVTDAADPALSGRGSFAVTTAAKLAAPEVVGPGPVEARPGDTLTISWTVRNHSNTGRLMDLVPQSGDASLILVSAVGAGRLRLEPGTMRSVEAKYRLASPSTAGTTRPAVLTVTDALSPSYSASSSVAVTTGLVLMAPAVAGPEDRTENPGSTFTVSWTVSNRTNASRRFNVGVALGSPTELELVSTTNTGLVTISEGGTAMVTATFRVRTDAVAGTSNLATLTATDADAPSYSSGDAFQTTTALVLRSPSVDAPGDQTAAPDQEFVVSWPVRNRTNASRVLAINPSVSSPGELTIVSSSGTGVVTFGPYELRTVTVRYRVRSVSVGGSTSTAELVVSDQEAPSYSGSSSFRFTTATLLRAPTVQGLGDRTGDPGANGSAAYRLSNRSNVRRSFALIATSSNPPVVGDPADPVQVTLEPFASTDVGVPFVVGSRAVAGTTSSLVLQATDTGDGALSGSGSAGFTTNLVLRAPGVTGGASRSGYSGETHGINFPLVNQSNARRRFALSVASSNTAVVNAPSVPASVEVDPFASVDVLVSFVFAATATGDLATTLTLTATDAESSSYVGSGSGTATRINRLPTASPTAGPNGQYTYTTIQAQANAGDQDGVVVAYEWYTINPWGSWSYLGSGANPTVEFPKSGTWRLWVRATDNNGGQASAYTDPITVVNRPPTIAPAFTPDGQYTYVPLQFSANAGDRDGSVVSYAWYVIDPGGGWTYISAEANPSFTPTRPGTWYGYVVATDDEGAQAGGFTSAITVLNRAPSVSPSASPGSGSKSTWFSFAANASDMDGSVVGYEWYLIDPSGNWRYASGAGSFGTTLNATGWWYGYVVAIDDSGARTGGYTGGVYVINTPPSASPSVSPGRGTRTTSFGFAANASDPDGWIAGYEWYLIDPWGNWRYAGGSASFSTTLEQSGWWYGYVVAIDNEGARSGAYTSGVYVNVPPSVGPTVNPTSGMQNSTSFGFAANASDPDGWITGYEWYLIDPSGNWRYAGGAASFSTTLDAAGWWYGYVVAVDSDGERSGGYTQAINVSPYVAPLTRPQLSGPGPTQWTVGDERALSYYVYNPNAEARVYCLRIRSQDNSKLAPPGGDGPDACTWVGAGATWHLQHTLRAYSDGEVYVTAYTYDQARPDLDASITFLNRILPQANQAPVASFSVDEEVNLCHKIKFSATSSSYDPDGAIVGYDWDVVYNGVRYGWVSGDGTPKITFEGPSDKGFSVTLVVTDNEGATATYSMSSWAPACM